MIKKDKTSNFFKYILKSDKNVMKMLSCKFISYTLIIIYILIVIHKIINVYIYKSDLILF